MHVTAEQGSQQHVIQTDLSVTAYGSTEVTICKAYTWFFISSRQESISSCSIPLFLQCMNYASMIKHIQM